MKLIVTIVILCFVLLIVDKSFGQRSRAHSDTLIVMVGKKVDTSNIKYSQPDIQRIILDKYNYPGYIAPGVVSFDIKRHFDFKLPVSKISVLNRLTIRPGSLSDSLLTSSRAFFRRHNFFVVITKNDTCYFYRAKGEYMYKNYKNDVQ